MPSITQTRRDLLQSAVAVAAVGAASTITTSASAALTETGKIWGVSAHPHFDRVMAPWMVKRFIDKNAKFVFAAKIEDLPKDVIPMGFATGEFSMHDAAGTCFHKVLVKYKIDDPALLALDKMNGETIEWFFHGTPVDMNDRYARWGYGLMGLSDAMLHRAATEGISDQQILDDGFPIYDAFYALIASEQKACALSQSSAAQKLPGMKTNCPPATTR